MFQNYFNTYNLKVSEIKYCINKKVIQSNEFITVPVFTSNSVSLSLVLKAGNVADTLTDTLKTKMSE